MDALEIKKSQNIEQIMLLEEKKFLLARAHLELNACKERSEDLEHELSLLKTRMEYIHYRLLGPRYKMLG